MQCYTDLRMKEVNFREPEVNTETEKSEQKVNKKAGKFGEKLQTFRTQFRHMIKNQMIIKS